MRLAAKNCYQINPSYAMLSSGPLWNTPRVTVFLYTHEHLGECVLQRKGK